MDIPKSDAFVFFGATGDLAFKKIFPALQAMIKHGHLDVPVIGVARSAKNVDELRARVRTSLEEHGGLDAVAFDKLSSLLRYVQGDNSDPMSVAATKGASLAVEREPGVGLRSGQRWAQEWRGSGYFFSTAEMSSLLTRGVR